jgi:hypothetical protein
LTYYFCIPTVVAVLFSGCAMAETQQQKEKCFVKPPQMGMFEGESKTLGSEPILESLEGKTLGSGVAYS